MVSESWERRQLTEAQAEKARAVAELRRTDPGYLETAERVERDRSERNLAASNERARRVMIGRCARGMATVTGRGVVVHSVWAVAIVATVWIVCQTWIEAQQ